MNKSTAYKISYPGYGEFCILGGSDLLKFRATSFLTKEPTTLEWLQSLEPNSVLIDIGANIGIYTLPAALFHVRKVIAVEPEAKNFAMLSENLEINGIDSTKCEAIPVAVSTKYNHQITKLYLTNDEAGASCHQVGANQDFKLRPLTTQRKYRTVSCLSLAEIVLHASSDHDDPIHVKIDVDGIEADVCQSIFDKKIISRISSFQIELNPEIEEHALLISLLNAHGFYFEESQILKSKRKSGTFEGYAEYVFRRCIPDAVKASFPKNISAQLGLQNDLGCMPSVSGDLSGFFSGNPTLVQTSKFPPSNILKNAFDYAKCSNLFQHLSFEALSSNDANFNFQSSTGGDSNQSLRFKIESDIIQDKSPNYWSELKDFTQSQELLKAVLRSVGIAVNTYCHPTFFKNSNAYKFLSGKQLFARARHFVDLYGYSLSKHHDSKDTLCAFIAPIFPYSSSTSVIDAGPIPRGFADALKASDRIYTDQFRDGNAYVTNGQFVDGIFAPLSKKVGPSNADPSSSEPLSAADKPWIMNGFPHRYRNVEVLPGEAFLLPNPGCKIFESPQWSPVEYILRNNFGHGVLPNVVDLYRPVLLIDFLLINDHTALSEASKTGDLFCDLGPSSAIYKSLIS